MNVLSGLTNSHNCRFINNLKAISCFNRESRTESWCKHNLCMNVFDVFESFKKTFKRTFTILFDESFELNINNTSIHENEWTPLRRRQDWFSCMHNKILQQRTFILFPDPGEYSMPYTGSINWIELKNFISRG